MKYKKTALLSAGLLSMVAVLIIFSVPFVTAVDSNITMTVDIVNQGPFLSTPSCSPASLTPTAGANTTVTCATNITDHNGVGDIDQTTLGAFLYKTGEVIGAADDLNDHYSNGTSSETSDDCAWSVQNGTTIQATCTFNTRHFIDPATWIANFTVNDTNGPTTNTSELTSYTVNSILGVDAHTTAIDFGTVELGNISSEQSTVIANAGNVQIDFNFSETANAGYLACDGTGSDNIATSNTTSGVRYNLTTSFDFDVAEQLAFPGTNYTEVNLNYYAATSTTDGASTDTMYWLLKVPNVSVGGTCTGTVTILAAEDN